MIVGVSAASHLIVTFLAAYLLVEQLDEKWMIIVSIGYFCVSTLVDVTLIGRRGRGPSSVIVAIVYILCWYADERKKRRFVVCPLFIGKQT